MIAPNIITLSGHEFKIVQEEQPHPSGSKTVFFYAIMEDGSRRNLRVEYNTELSNVLYADMGIQFEAELASVLEQEIKMELFQIIHNVSIRDVLSGKHPELLREYVASHMDINYIDPEVQEKYIDIIAEVLNT